MPDPGPEIDLPAAPVAPRYRWSAFLSSGYVLTTPCESFDAACRAARAALRMRGALSPDVRIIRHLRGHDGGVVFRPDGSRDPDTWRVALRH